MCVSILLVASVCDMGIMQTEVTEHLRPRGLMFSASFLSLTPFERERERAVRRRRRRGGKKRGKIKREVGGYLGFN